MSETTTVESQKSALAGIPPRPSVWTTTGTLLRWSFSSIGAMLPLFVVVQAALAAGIILGFGFLIPDIDTATAQFLSTGAPTVLLMVIGLVIVPQGVAQARTNGTFTYQRALPVARWQLLVTNLTVWMVVALPGIPVALSVAQLRYGFSYSFDWPLLVAAAVLATLMASAVGYAIGATFPPMLSQLVSQVLVFFVLLFSPITFVASQLPDWFQSLHDVLPFRPAGDLIRAGLLSDTHSANGQDLVVLGVWCVLGLVVSVRALVRRA